MDKIVLFEDKKDCCGCGACMNKCPKKAITMCEDEAGFVYPVINEELCVKCGACQKACGFKSEITGDTSFEQKVFAFSSKDDVVITTSASGGAFAEIAKKVLTEKNGVVYGSISENRDKDWKVHHTRIDNINDLSSLQGSKYVQSEIGTTYSDVKQDLSEGRFVLFSGTPCQIDGLNHYLGKQYDNLLTVDIICHGVPSRKLYTDFLRSQEEKLGCKIDRFVFRDKSKGQGMISRMDIVSGKSIVKKGELYSYFYLFLKQHIYRINCYSCPYARRERVSDLTLGDFWGFGELYPNLDSSIGLTDKRGVSCVLVNTQKGLDCFNELKDSCITMESDFEKAAYKNGQLSHPSSMSGVRNEVISSYAKQGYKGVESYYHTHFFKDRAKYSLSAIIPMEVKRKMRKLLHG